MMMRRRTGNEEGILTLQIGSIANEVNYDLWKLRYDCIQYYQLYQSQQAIIMNDSSIDHDNTKANDNDKNNEAIDMTNNISRYFKDYDIDQTPAMVMLTDAQSPENQIDFQYDNHLSNDKSSSQSVYFRSNEELEDSFRDTWNGKAEIIRREHELVK